jgi:DNA repair and recombination protein RAD52
MFTPEQKTALAAPLDPKHVKPPAPGKHGDYIEGWRVIDEANRIFGFDGWTRETVEMEELCRDLMELSGNNGPYKQWRVSYRAKVRISAGGIVREGTGCGSGSGKPEALGDVIESAIKEAETDAMKRALMTFGNPFVLALYDKTKANVQAPPREPDASVQIAVDGINACETQLALKQWWKQNDAAIGAMADADYKTVFDAFEKRRKAVETMDRSAA